MFSPLLLLFVTWTSQHLSGAEGALGSIYPYVENAIIGRGIDLNTNQVKETVLKEKFETSKHKVTKFDGKYTMVEDMTDETNMLDVSGRLKLGIEGGFSIGAEGIGAFAQRSRDMKQKLEATFTISAFDYYEVVRSIETSARPDCGSMKADAKAISHVVGGVLYGAKCLVRIDWAAKTSEERRRIMGEFNLNFGKEDKFNIEVGGNVDMVNQDNNTNYNYDMKVSCNMEIERLPKSFKELSAFIKELPKAYARVKTVPRGSPISMYVVPIGELKGCTRPLGSLDVGIPSTNAVIDQFYTDLSVMIGDSQGAGDFLEKCKRTHEIPDDNTGVEIYSLDRAFYFMKRALDRKAVLLFQELNPNGSRRQFAKVGDVLNFVTKFEAIYADFQTSAKDGKILDFFRKFAPSVRTVVENSAQETQIPHSNHVTIGRNVWMTRARAMCLIRKEISNRLRAAF